MSDDCAISVLVEQTVIEIGVQVDPIIVAVESADIIEVTVDSSPLIMVSEESPSRETIILESSERGPRGPMGATEISEDMRLSKRIEFLENDTVIYRGEALPGTRNDEPKWAIRKFVAANEGEDIRETWANGDAEFDKVWNDRLLYTYI